MYLHHQMPFLTRAWTGSGAQPVPTPRWSRERSESRAVIAALFSCFFAAQSGQLALTPVLTDAAADFGLSTSRGGADPFRRRGRRRSRRAIALVVGVPSVRLQTLLWLGLALVASGSAMSLVAGSVRLLTVGQALAGAAPRS